MHHHINENSRKAVINIETHLLRKGGVTYAESIMDHLFWEKYLQVFDEIYVLARAREYSGENLDKWILTDHENVHFVFLPEYRGPKGYLLKYIEIGRCMKQFICAHKDVGCAIVRSPSGLGYRFLRYWKRTGKPYAMEIVSNLSDSYYYSLGLIRSILYRILHDQTIRYAREANGVAYVSKGLLQDVYPTKSIKASYSSLDITRECYYRRPLLIQKKDKYTLVHVSTLALDSKGNKEFLDVQKRLIDKGYNVESVVVGGGRLLEKYIDLAEKMGIAEKVQFTGHISQKDQLFKVLRQSDIMLFPTLTEGMPRTVIEAMANSLPCVTSDIPVMHELIEERWLCDPRNVEEMAQKVELLINDTEIYNRTAERNYESAGSYEYDILNEQRRVFYRRVSEL